MEKHLQKILAFNFNSVLTDVIEELKLRGHQVVGEAGLRTKNDWKLFDTIVLWSETESGGMRGLIPKMQKTGKRVILVQHGRRGTSRIFEPFNEKLICDKVCLWGQGDYDRYIEAGNPKEKLVITGNPVVKWMKDNTQRKPHEGKNIIFFPEHWGVEVPENIIVAGQLRKSKYKVTTLPLLGEHGNFYPNPVFGERGTQQNFDLIKSYLEIADVVVSVSESTVALFAQILDIPVVIADIWQPKAGADGDERYKTYRREYSNACDRVKNIFEINKRIEYAIKHPEYLRSERFIVGQVDGGTNIENPVDNIIKVILDEDHISRT